MSKLINPPFVHEPVSNTTKASIKYHGFFSELPTVASIEDALKSFDEVQQKRKAKFHSNFLRK